jgi:hypothetical protein
MSRKKKDAQSQMNNHNEGMQFYNDGDVHIHTAVAGSRAQAIHSDPTSAMPRPATRYFLLTFVSIVGAVIILGGLAGIIMFRFNLLTWPISSAPSPRPTLGGTVIAPPATASANSPGSHATPTPSQLETATPDIDVALAMRYYNQYMALTPTLIDTPSQAKGWFQGSPAYATCMDEGSQGYHVVALSEADSGACIAPAPNLQGNYALQTELSVQTGAGAGLAFAFTSNPSIDTNYNGSLYYLGYCGNSGPYCSLDNLFLDHVQNGQPVQCLGPEPDATYSSRSDACLYQSPFIYSGFNVSNVLTVIVHDGTIYTYINAHPVFIFMPHSPVDYSTAGKVGCVAISGANATCRPIKIWAF